MRRIKKILAAMVVSVFLPALCLAADVKGKVT